MYMFKLKDFIKRKWWIILIVIAVLNLLSKKSTNPENSSSENHSSSSTLVKIVVRDLEPMGICQEEVTFIKFFRNLQKPFVKHVLKENKMHTIELYNNL